MAAADLAIHPDLTPRVVSREGVQLREDTLYSNHKGKEKKGIRKRAEKALGKLHEPLRKVLKPEEAILYVAQAQAPASIFEQLAFGWYVYYVARTVLVLTNRRLLHFQVTRDGTWKKSLRSVAWGDLEQGKVKGLLSPQLRLKYRSGKKDTYWALPRADARKIKLLLSVLLPESQGDVSPAQQMVSLCPESMTPLTPGTYQCPECSLTFKDERTMTRLSLLYPGGGYFYAGHWFLGVGDALVEAVLLAWVVAWGLVGLGLAEQNLDPLDTAFAPGAALGAAGFAAVVLAVEKLFTIHHGRRFVRDFIPAGDIAKSSRWTVIGVLSYALVALIVWAQITPKQDPIARVAPDLVVSRAHFGLFATYADGSLSFLPGNVVPLTTGQEFGWVLRVKTTRETIKWREEIYLHFEGEESSDTLENDAVDEYSLQTTVNEGENAPVGGVLGSYWTIGPDDQAGNYTMKLYIDEVLVDTFAFEIR